MNQLVTTAIVLSRTDYGEADRIITVITPDHGKLRLVAKGVRRIKSKLAGGIELFSISSLTYIKGRSELGTLVSARLEVHYGHIVEDIQRTMLGYELIKQLHKATEDEPEPEYFHLLKDTFAALDDAPVPLEVIAWWFQTQLLRFDGHTPNLDTDSAGQRLTADQTYTFDYGAMAFVADSAGSYTTAHLKVLRLAFAGNTAGVLARVQGISTLLPALRMLVQYLTSQV